MNEIKTKLGKYEELFQAKMEELKAQKIISRIWEKDHAVWRNDPAEISNRLGWLDCADVAQTKFNEITEFVEQIKGEGFKNVLLMGMGGSSLAPEVFAKIFGVKDGYMNLSVIDSTHPDAVKELEDNLDPKETLYIVSTKSGGTVETISFMKRFYNDTLQVVGAEKVGKHFTAITDPGSGLESMAKELNFRKIFLNDPNIGGRYSALSFFGIVPAALIGVDLHELFIEVQKMIDYSKEENNSVAQLGVAVGVLAEHGVDKLTFILSDGLKPFGAWVEQLIAESTGKDGKGILPVEGEELLAPIEYSHDRVFVNLHLADDNKHTQHVSLLAEAGFPVIDIPMENIIELGAEYFKWEMATVIASWVIDIQPFDQPNVESAKVIARKMMSDYLEKGELTKLTPTLTSDSIKVYNDVDCKSVSEVLPEFLKNINEGENSIIGRSYIAIQAYVKMDENSERILHELRTKLQKKYQVATTVGFGPRFLHSTGQLHKGDAGNGLFIQIVSPSKIDVDIPDEPGKEESSITFGVLIESQVLGDRQALIDNNRKIIRFDVSDLSEDINKLV
ncbi:Glucose-6-phosphate isomerase [hydrothermal vent metagenome]|uniref:Glucose-6-phosphate isomerase n=1 Tax=hydrothermal vent metagenome TaxID=652676 RepID=A0A3B1BUF0_9ZZZZ